MSEVLVTSKQNAIAFNPESMLRDARERWSHAAYVPSSEYFVDTTFGQLKITSGGQTVLVEFLVPGQGLGVEGDDILVAEFLEWLADWPDLPPETTAWPSQSAEPLQVRPGLTAQQLLEAEG